MLAINHLPPPTRFLLRGSALVIILLTLWWLIPLNPLLFLLRTAAEVSGSILFGGRSPLTVTEASNGVWTFDVPLEATLPRTGANAVAQRIHSIGFELERSEAGAFTFGLPVLWALILAAPGVRRNLRPLLFGTLAMALLEVALVLFTAKILAYKSLAQLVQSQDPFGAWLLRFGQYLTASVIPYLLPFAVAIWIHRELREQIFEWAAPLAAPAPVAKKPAVAAKRRS